MSVHIEKLHYNNHSIDGEIQLLPITILLGKTYLNINHSLSMLDSLFPIIKLFNPNYNKETYNMYYKNNEFSNGVIIAPDFGHNWHHDDLQYLWDEIYEAVTNKNVQFIAHTQSKDVLHGLAYLLKRNNVDVNESNLALVVRIDEHRKEEVIYSHQDIIVCANYDIEMR